MNRRTSGKGGRPIGSIYPEAENHLSSVRVLYGVTQAELAKASGASMNFVCSLELGYTPPIKKNGAIKKRVDRICRYLNVDPTDMFPRYICGMKKAEINFDQAAEIVGHRQVIDAEQAFILAESTARFWEKFFSIPTRNAQMIYEYFVTGKTYRQIGRDFGVCGTRVKQLVNKGLRMLRHPSIEMDEFKNIFA